MDLIKYIDELGDGVTLTLGSLLIGLLFGIFAQRNRFCMRAAVIEFSKGTIGPKVTIWLLAFSAAVAGTQLLIAGDLLDVSSARQLAARGSVSGALLGGLMFGCGMILSRGCASRLLVLSATGNLRALVSGLILTVTAQASLRGVLSPVRLYLSELWTVEGGYSRDLIAILGLNGNMALVAGLAFLAAALFFALRNRVSIWITIGALGVGLMIALGWFFTYSMSYQSFEQVPVTSISFIGPSADTLMSLINSPTLPFNFSLGLVPGVFAGSLLAALLGRDIKMECFGGDRRMPRYIVGAALMGFGGMLAGGCAVGAGVTGGSVFSMTAWVALSAMWAGAGLTNFLVDNHKPKTDIGVVSTPVATG